MKTLPTVRPRRPYMGDVYLESDRDYVLNNLELCVGLLDQLAETTECENKKACSLAGNEGHQDCTPDPKLVKLARRKK